jgi:hypothetical protein
LSLAVLGLVFASRYRALGRAVATTQLSASTALQQENCAMHLPQIRLRRLRSTLTKTTHDYSRFRAPQPPDAEIYAQCGLIAATAKQIAQAPLSGAFGNDRPKLSAKQSLL